MFILSLFLLISSISVTIRRDVSILISRSAILILICCLYLSCSTTNLTILAKNLGLFGGLFQISPIIQIFKTFVYMLSIVILLLTSYYPRKYLDYNDKNFINIESNQLKRKISSDFPVKDEIFSHSFILNKMNEQFRILEYSLIILLILTGTMFLLSTSDFVSLFLSIELQSYGLYLVCSLYKNSELATSAGLTYFLLGGLASCFILLGTAILYSNSANMNLDGLYIITHLSNVMTDNISRIDWYLPNYIYYSLLILAIGLLFKISAAPFHFWSPDVYDNIPTIVTTFVALIPKLSILVFMLELVHYTGNMSIDSGLTWTSGLLLSSFLSLIIGTVLGLTQSRIKRLFAYSTISHLGFILLALSVNSIESNQSFMFYLIQYTVSNLNAFIILLAMGYGLFFYISDNAEYNKLQDKNNSPIQLTNQLKGYHFLNPVLAMSLAITLFSFVGIPPLIGFFGKQMVLSSALDKGYVFLVLTAIFTSVIAAVYYLAIIKIMYFDKHEYTVVKLDKYNVNYIVLSNYLSICISVITMLITLFIIIPQEFLNMTNILTLVTYVVKDIMCEISNYINSILLPCIQEYFAYLQKIFFKYPDLLTNTQKIMLIFLNISAILTIVIMYNNFNTLEKNKIGLKERIYLLFKYIKNNWKAVLLLILISFSLKSYIRDILDIKIEKSIGVDFILRFCTWLPTLIIWYILAQKLFLCNKVGIYLNILHIIKAITVRNTFYLIIITILSSFFKNFIFDQVVLIVISYLFIENVNCLSVNSTTHLSILPEGAPPKAVPPVILQTPISHVNSFTPINNTTSEVNSEDMAESSNSRKRKLPPEFADNSSPEASNSIPDPGINSSPEASNSIPDPSISSKSVWSPFRVKHQFFDPDLDLEQMKLRIRRMVENPDSIQNNVKPNVDIAYGIGTPEDYKEGDVRLVFFDTNDSNSEHLIRAFRPYYGNTLAKTYFQLNQEKRCGFFLRDMSKKHWTANQHKLVILETRIGQQITKTPGVWLYAERNSGINITSDNLPVVENSFLISKYLIFISNKTNITNITKK